MIHSLTRQIRAFDKQVEKTTEESYPEALHLRQIAGVGPLTSLAYVLVLEDPKRFPESRAVGAYVGLVPKLDETGGPGNGPERPITKAGNMLLRRLLVSAAHYILGHEPDTDLQRCGSKRWRGCPPPEVARGASAGGHPHGQERAWT
jgi:transposase